MKNDNRSRRSFLATSGAAGAIGVMEWLDWFRSSGVPGTAKTWDIAHARAQQQAALGGGEEPRILVYWFQEGGWQSYSMFSPVDTPNHAALTVAPNTLEPVPPWSEQYYRVTEREVPGSMLNTSQGIRHGYLASPGISLFPELSVVSSHHGNVFHSGGRWDYHYGCYDHSLTSLREADERTVLQAFCEAKGAGWLLPHISWHRWLADGELDPAQYPDGTGYYERLGPSYAHTVYGRFPDDLRGRLQARGSPTSAGRRRIISQYTEQLYQNLIADRDGQSVQAFASALDIHRQLSEGEFAQDPASLFTDQELRDRFGVEPAHELPSYLSVNGNPARSKDTPHVRVQAMMAYELMRAGISNGFWIESQGVRRFDHHRVRSDVTSAGTAPDQYAEMLDDLWDPLLTFVELLKQTEMPGLPGRSLFEQTTIVLCSEMGRTIQGDVGPILASDGTVDEKYTQIMAQDVCQHWRTSSVAFLGGNVKAGTQFGRVGSATLDSIPLVADGTLDPAFDPETGLQRSGQTQTGIVTDAGHVYATALLLSDVEPSGKGRNERPPLSFIHKDG